jgi:two-component system sensor histidine kinase AlgZ
MDRSQRSAQVCSGVSDRAARDFEQSRLPGQLVYFYLGAPLLAFPILRAGFFGLPPRRMLLEVIGSYFPFLAIAAGIHAFYRFAWPLVPRVQRLGHRLLLKATMSALVTVVMGVVVHPLCVLISAASSPLAIFLAKCVIVAVAFHLPVSLVQELHARTHAAQTAERTALRAQLEAIQLRTTPHFLFNALNTIASLVRDDPPLAERTIERLAGMLRYTLKSAQLDDVSLEREIGMVKDYLEIQRARFGERLKYAISVEPGMESQRLPPFLLQPLVENAILHSLATRPVGGLVRLLARRRDDKAELRVDDDGPGPAGSSHHGNGIGLSDLRKRLELLYGTAYCLDTFANELGGFSVQLLIPVGGKSP